MYCVRCAGWLTDSFKACDWLGGSSTQLGCASLPAYKTGAVIPSRGQSSQWGRRHPGMRPSTPCLWTLSMGIGELMIPIGD